MTVQEDAEYEYSGAIRPKDLRLRIVPTGRSECPGGLFDGVLMFAKGPENKRDEPYELALKAKGLRGSRILPLASSVIDTKILVPKSAVNVGLTEPVVEVVHLPNVSAEEVLSRYAGFEHNGIDRELPAPELFVTVLIDAHGIAVSETVGEDTRVIALCNWRPRGKLDAMR